jgi:hypothetical protein
MNFMKWFLYSLAFGAFIWFVFFKPMGDNTALATQPNNEETAEEVDTYTDIPNEEEEEITFDMDYESMEDTMQVVSEEIPVVELPVDLPDNTSSENTSSENINSTNINLNKRYLIVVGSFGVKSNANRMLSKVKDAGNDGVITSIKGLHRVVMASTDDKSEAINLRLQFTEPAFILKQ